MVTEIEVIKLFRKFFRTQIYDDVGYIRWTDDKFLLFNIDTFVKSTDAPKGMDYYYMGWKSIISSISDIYVKGGIPRYLCISINLSKNDVDYMDRLAAGIKDATNKYELETVKWDTNKAEDLSITVFSLGISRRHPILRSGAREGDIIVATDYFGLERLGLDIFLNRIHVEDKKLEIKARNRFLKPEIKRTVYKTIFNTLEVHASIDSSDGLARSLWELSRASNKKIKLLNLPVHPLILNYNFNEEYLAELTLYGGEEYIGIFSVSQDNLSDLPKDVVVIAKVMGEGIGVYNPNNEIIREKGWLHRF